MAERKDVGRLLNKRWLLVIAYVGVIFILSAQPGFKVPGSFIYKDKVAHALEYGGLSLLMHRDVRTSWPHVGTVRRALLTVLAIAVLAATDEWFQKGIPQRDSSPYDWMADMIGACLSQAWGVARDKRRGRA